MERPNVTILLPTYNGSAYLASQLDSLLAQDYPNLQIVISDDASTDTTVQIINRYAAAHPDRILHFKSGQHFGNAQDHFMHLLRQFSEADYIMFCDQDDVWHADKVSKTMARMKAIEQDTAVPALVHTDLRVVDADLSEISPSFCQHSDLQGDRLALNQLLVQNVVTGCTVMINRSLAQLASTCAQTGAMRMHDWWLALLASACGRIAFLNEATIDYRQHGSNSVGAKNVRSPSYFFQRLTSSPMRKGMRLAAEQAEAFLACYTTQLTPEQQKLICAFASTKDKGLLGRDLVYIRHNLLKSGFVRRFSQLTGL